MKRNSSIKTPKSQNAPIVEQLSERVLYSADPLGLSSDLVLSEERALEEQISVDAHVVAELSELSAINDESLTEELFANDSRTRTEVIFINMSVTDYQQIVDALTQSSDDDVNYVIYTLQSSQSIEDVNQTLSQHQQLDAVHFITHGADAHFNLGSSHINSENLAGHADSFEQWGAALADHGDILFYGCNFAETAEGQQLVASIAAATNADVGASDNRTGHETLNADWRLEFSVGQIDTDSTRMENILNDWESQLETIIVETTDDVVDATDTSSVSNLLANPGADGKISLREAIIAANADYSTEDFIQLSSGTYTLTTVSDPLGDPYFGDLDINSPMTIQGADTDTVTISAAGIPERVIEIFGASQVTLSNLTIADGSQSVSGGGIYSEGTAVTLDNVDIENNTSDYGGGLFLKGGLLHITNVQVEDNVANDQGGGLFIEAATVTANRVQIDGNAAVNTGGGLYVSASTVYANDIDVTQNTSGSHGGGLYFNSGNFTGLGITINSNSTNPTYGQGGGAYINSGTLFTVYESEFSDNNASGGGAGAYEGAGAFVNGELRATDTVFQNNESQNLGGGVYNNGTTILERSLVHLNSATDGTGGGIYNNGSVLVYNSTIAENYSGLHGSAVHAANGDVVIDRSTITKNHTAAPSTNGDTLNIVSSGKIKIQHTLIAANTAAIGSSTIDPAVVTNGNNLADISIPNKQSTDRELISNHNLSPTLSNNGGVVETYALLTDSAAIDTGSRIETRSNGPTLDATGAPRTSIGDIGAYEYRQTGVTYAPVVTINEPLVIYIQGDEGTVTLLSAIDSDTPTTDLVYTVTSLPVDGNLRLTTGSIAAPASVGSTFTQADLLEGKVTYQHTGTTGYESYDSFSFFVSDGTNNSENHEFDILIEGWNLAPELDNSETYLFNTQSAADTDPPGTYVSDLLQSRAADGITDAITDENIGSPEGIAIIKVDESDGIWEYKADRSDASWTAVTPVSAPYSDVQDAYALLLEPTSLIRFVPDDNDFTGTARIDFRAHDFAWHHTAGQYLHNDAPYTSGLIGPNGPHSELVGSAEISIVADDIIDPVPNGPAPVTTPEDTSYVFTGAERVSIDDPSAKDYELQVVLKVTNGTLSLSTTNYIDVQGNHSNEVILEGLRSDINAALTNLAYTPDMSYYGDDDLVINTSIAVDRVLHYSFDDDGNATDYNHTTANDGILVNGATVDNGFLEHSDENDLVGIQTDLGITDAVTLAGWIEIPDRDEQGFIVSIGGVVALFYDGENDELIGEFISPPFFYQTVASEDLDGNSSGRHHVAYTIDPVLNQQTIYINGEEKAQTNYQETIAAPFVPPATLIGDRLVGKMDDIQVFTRALSADEIKGIWDLDNNLTKTTTVDIEVVSVAEPPILTGTQTSPLIFIEGDTPPIITANTDITDDDDTHIESATVSISNNFAAGEDTLNFSDQFGITGSFDNTSGILTLTGSATLSDYQKALRSITFKNTSESPSELTREVSFFVSDGDHNSNTVTRNIMLTAVNDAPTFDIPFTPDHQVTTTHDNAKSVTAADIDGDGDLDVLAVSSDDNKVAWHENIGNGNFVAHTVTTNATLAHTGTVADIDNDGDLDLLAGTANSVTWFENDGSQNFTEHSIDSTVDNVRSVTTDDVDGDGDIDVLAAIRNEDTIAWYENDGAQNFTRHDISATATEANTVKTEDLDGDGDIDILSVSQASDASVVWYENDGNQNFDQQVITPTTARSVTTGDIDGDGHIDVVTAHWNPGSVEWHKNDGNQGWSRIPIDTAAPGARRLSTVDLDGDGDLDVLAAIWLEGTITWYENDGNQNFTRDDIATGIAGASDVTTADIDADGDLDVLYTSATNDIVGWIENSGSAVTTLDGNPSYVEDGPAVILDADVQLFDEELNALDNFDGASLTLIRTGGANTEDEFSITDPSIVANTAIGTYTNTGGILNFDFGPGATANLVNDLLQSIAYNNTNDTPPSSVDIEWTFNDGNITSQGTGGPKTVTGTTTVNITPSNDAPQLATIEGLPASHIENGQATQITGNLSLSDVDDINIESATISITNNHQSTEDELLFTDQLGITHTYDSANGVMTLSGSASIADYRTALHSITYKNNSDNPTTLTRTITFQINDGDDSSGVRSRDIIINAENDAPSLSDIENTDITYTENDLPIIITGTTLVSDIDDTMIESATVAITNGFASGEDVLGFTTQAGVTGNFDSGTGTLTLNGSATLNEYQDIIQSITYHNTSDNPSELNRTVAFEIFDGDQNSNSVTRNIIFTAANDAPTLATIEGQPATHTENGQPTKITGNLSLFDVDDTNIETATISITGNFHSAEDELLFTDQLGITHTYDSVNGVMTLSGSASIADYQTALHSITYKNNSDNPTTLTRTITFQINDGDDSSGVRSRDIEVFPVNNAPTLQGNGAPPPQFTENGSAQIVLPLVNIKDVDDTHLESASFSFVNNYVSGEDFLRFTDQSGITGSFNQSTGVLSLTGHATVPDYQTALRSVTYENTSETPSTLQRSISIVVNDGDEDSNAIASRKVDVIAVNDAPTLATIEGQPATHTENGQPTKITGNLSLFDVDDTNIETATISITGNFHSAEDELLFTDQLGITHTYDSVNGVMTLSGSASIADYQTALHSITYKNNSDNPTTLTRTITFQINDGDDSSGVRSRDIIINAKNDAPSLSDIENTDITYTENDLPIIITGTTLVSDIDDTMIESATVAITNGFASGEDVLGFTTKAGITGNFDANTGTLTLTGSATLNEYQDIIQSITYHNTSDNPSELNRTVAFEIFDGDQNSNSVTRDIIFTAVNDAPVISGIESTGVTYTENDSAKTVTNTIVLTDVDDTWIESATVSITSNFSTGEDILNFADQNNITGTFNDTDGVLTLEGSATVSDYQTALQSITYENTSNNPSDLTRTISFAVSDGTSNSNSITRDIAFTAVNDAPRLSSIEGRPAIYTENAAPVVITGNLNVADVDDINIESATIAITGNHIPAEDELSVVLDSTSGIVANYNSATGVLSLTGSSSATNYEAAIHAVKYQNLSNNPTIANRTVTFTVNDGDLNSFDKTREIEIVGVNNAPSLHNLESTSLQFTEGDSDLSTTADIAIADVDNATLQSAVVSVENYVTGEDQLVIDNAALNGISASFDTTTGELQLTGNATVNNYQQALRAVTYANNSEHPTNSARTISYTVNDGMLDSVPTLRALEVTPVNDKPLTANFSATVFEDTDVVIPFTDLPFIDAEIHDLLEVIVDTTNPNVSVDNTARTVTYTPDPDFNGTDAFTFQVKDNGGTANSGADTSTPAVVNVDVMSVNDSPAVANVSLPSEPEDSTPGGQLIASLIGPVFSDIDTTDTLTGIAITGNAESPANGQWQYLLPGGVWQNINDPLSSPTDSSALLLSKDTAIRFLPAADYNGTPLPLTYKAIDSSYSGSFSIETQRITQDTANSTNSSFLSNVAEISTQITAINDAPVIGNVTLDPQLEDNNASAPMQIVDLFSAQYSDEDGTAALSGIAITSNPAIAAEGNWQYSSNGNDWHNINAVDDTTALLLDRDAFVRFSPAADFFGDPSDLLLRAVDGTFTAGFTTDNTNRATLDTTTAGNMVSAEHAISITILPVNDAPQGSDSTISIVEDSNYSFSAADFGFFDPVESDAFSGITIQSLPVHGTLLLNGQTLNSGDWVTSTDLDRGNLTYVPATNSTNQDSWDFAVSDNGGTNNNGFDQDQGNNTVTINIEPVNDAPSGTSKTIGAVESTPVQFTVADFGFTDLVEQDAFQSVLIETVPASGSFQLNGVQVEANDLIDVRDIAAGLLTFTPAPLSVASVAEFDFNVVDDGGTQNNGRDTSNIASTVTIMVETDNNPPTGRDNTITLNEDSTITLTTTMFGYADSVDGHSMEGVVISGIPTNGTLIHNGTPVSEGAVISTADLNTGLLTFTPAPDESGIDYANLQFKVLDAGIDNSGKHISVDEYTLTINVTPVNDAPTISGEENLQLAENTSSNNIGSITTTDADSSDTHRFTVDDTRFEVVDGALALKPGITLDFETESQIPLQITVIDSAGATATHDVLLEVQNINEAPQTEPVTDQAETAPFTIELSETLFTDVDGDTLTTTATLADGSPLPEWLLFEEGRFSIAEDAPIGMVDVVLTATDTGGLTATSTMKIEVKEEPPIAKAQAELPAFATMETATEVEVEEETAEPEVILEDNAKPESVEPEEQFEAEKIKTSETREIQQQLPEVIQLETLSTVNTSALDSNTDIGIVLANDFNVLLTQSDYSTDTVRQQNAFTALTLKNLAAEADRNKSTLANNQVITPTVLATSVTLTSGLSVGYILWLLRGGTLLASVMASMPAWRAIDPLPVLEGLTGGDDDDTETLESMVEDTESEEPADPKDSADKAA